LVVEGIVRHTAASSVVVSSRGLREGLALGDTDGEMPTPRWVRTISVATLAARFATWNRETSNRRATIAGRLHESLDVEAGAFVRELLEHASTLVDVGRAIDYYDRFAHAATIVTAADLAGFGHEGLGMLAGIVRQADTDLNLGPYRRLISADNREEVLRAATALALADELNRRIPPGRPATVSCTWHPGAFMVAAPVPSGWRPRAVAERFPRVFGRPLHVVSAEDVP
jgi:exopolyphosphatase/pppGpp-phosphohydrolase